jgi:hypothetical protein
MEICDDFNSKFKLKESWIDPRLAFDGKYPIIINSQIIDKLWKPYS